MSLQKNRYLSRMEERRARPLGEAALALVELWTQADLQNRRDIGRNLTNEFYRVLTQVSGWQAHEAKFATAELTRAFKEVLS